MFLKRRRKWAIQLKQRLNIKDNLAELNSFDTINKKAGSIVKSNEFNSSRPLNFKVIFNIENGFTINYQGENIVTLENKFNITNASGIKVITNNDIIIL